MKESGTWEGKRSGGWEKANRQSHHRIYTDEILQYDNTSQRRSDNSAHATVDHTLVV